MFTDREQTDGQTETNIASFAEGLKLDKKSKGDSLNNQESSTYHRIVLMKYYQILDARGCGSCKGHNHYDMSF